MKKFLFISFLVPLLATAQDSTVQNLSFTPFLKKARHFKPDDYLASRNNSFYIYRNCVYRILPASGGSWTIRVTGIRNDSIYYEHYGEMKSFRKDTLFRLHPSEISSILLSPTEAGQMLHTLNMSSFYYTFSRHREAKAFPEQKATIITQFSPDSSSTHEIELTNMLNHNGIVPLFKKCDRPYYYTPDANLDCYAGRALDGPPPYPIVTRDVVWFTPSKAKRINGVNIGLISFLGGEDTLKISGVNLNADLLSVFFTMYLPFIPQDTTWKHPETYPPASKYDPSQHKIHGLSLSAGGVIDGSIRGVAINGSICMLSELRGICITGIKNRFDEFHGLAIGGIANLSYKGRGVQIGLVNKCKDLRGVQFGLWNVNGKRRLPLINWNFSKA
ncbi:MAG: LA_2272 family surface repeat-containing protein [Pseudobacter sp.]|uniref:LA_2272 family surface repeat-containing protein n=1 Tax=Pseudobacter sp. TaxID=2045420 RepID=UPI003F818D26